MSTFVALFSVLCVVALGVVAARWGSRWALARQRGRRRAARWTVYASGCPDAPAPAGATFPLVPGLSPPGTLAIHADGLCLSLPSLRPTPLWLPWSEVYTVMPADDDRGVTVAFAHGLAATVPAEAGRALWDAQAQRIARSPQPATAS